MNISRRLLRIWLTVSSFVGFIAGWIFLSHTTDTDTITQVGNTKVNMPEVQAIPTLRGMDEDSDRNDVQTFSINPNSAQPSFSPNLRTGGS